MSSTIDGDGLLDAWSSMAVGTSNGRWNSGPGGVLVWLLTAET